MVMRSLSTAAYLSRYADYFGCESDFRMYLSKKFSSPNQKNKLMKATLKGLAIVGVVLLSTGVSVSRRHYIRDVEFARVITGLDRSISISRQDFVTRFPQRGTDFRRW